MLRKIMVSIEGTEVGASSAALFGSNEDLRDSGQFLSDLYRIESMSQKASWDKYCPKVGDQWGSGSVKKEPKYVAAPPRWAGSAVVWDNQNAALLLRPGAASDRRRQIKIRTWRSSAHGWWGEKMGGPSVIAEQHAVAYVIFLKWI